MANNMADGAAVVGSLAMFVLAPFTGGASLLGIPVLVGARIARECMDEGDSAQEKKERCSMISRDAFNAEAQWMTPASQVQPYTPIPRYDFGMGALYGQYLPRGDAPRTQLARLDPELGHNLMRHDNDSETLRSVSRGVEQVIVEMARNHPQTKHVRVSVTPVRRWFGPDGLKWDIEIL